MDINKSDKNLRITASAAAVVVPNDDQVEQAVCSDSTKPTSRKKGASISKDMNKGTYERPALLEAVQYAMYYSLQLLNDDFKPSASANANHVIRGLTRRSQIIPARQLRQQELYIPPQAFGVFYDPESRALVPATTDAEVYICMRENGTDFRVATEDLEDFVTQEFHSEERQQIFFTAQSKLFTPKAVILAFKKYAANLTSATQEEVQTILDKFDPLELEAAASKICARAAAEKHLLEALGKVRDLRIQSPLILSTAQDIVTRLQRSTLTGANNLLELVAEPQQLELQQSVSAAGGSQQRIDDLELQLQQERDTIAELQRQSTVDKNNSQLRLRDLQLQLEQAQQREEEIVQESNQLRTMYNLLQEELAMLEKKAEMDLRTATEAFSEEQYQHELTKRTLWELENASDSDDDDGSNSNADVGDLNALLRDHGVDPSTVFDGNYEF